ncbi:Na(+)/H(+) exchanger beta-like isoform X2 [Anneissia japonica]|uniref:Na(+)/H(+) exchanger beta-like isoform X2 n=1 Tax=Anneissia japonica TaxID=1529436 RepID=UPI00142564C9|nr:Na(+)/H(+) exchanger beta-like isoform X2 [Anneissia japonica]
MMYVRYELWVAVALLADFTLASSDREQVLENNGSKESHADEDHGGVHLVQWNFDHVEVPLTITLAVLLVGVAKLGFHKVKWLSSRVPESALIIVVGTALGSISVSKGTIFISFDETTFFLYLLPPIILESAYSLYDRVFSNNLGTILLYAVVGSLLNFGLIGGSLYGVCAAGACGSFAPTIWQCLAFSALISAVDPVAVLAIFQEIHVNNKLYFLVFGESLLNDAVTVVLYNMMVAFMALDVIPASQVVLGVFSFFTISLGGLVIGIIIGMLSAFMTKFTRHVRVVEPLTILGMAYLSYIMAELFHWSGIIGIIGCGLVQCEYAFGNISRKSNITVKYFIKVLSMTSESIIFFSLGQTMWDNEMVWNSGFILLTLVFCFIFRCFSVTLLTNISNMNRIIKINMEEQFIMAYGGLRGAVAYALVIQLRTGNEELDRLFITCTLAVVFATVFIQGLTIKPFVNFFRIRKQETQKPTMCDEVNRRVIDFMMAGIEEVTGQKGGNYLRVKLEYYDEKYLKRWLQRNPETREAHMMALFEEIALKDHREHIYDIAKAPLEIEGACLIKRVCTLERAISVDCGELELEPKRYEAYRPIKGNFSTDDLRKLWRNNPSISMHLPYDKNLTQDDDQDLAVQLRQRKNLYMEVKKRHSSMSRQSAIDEVPDEEEDEGGIVMKFEPTIKEESEVDGPSETMALMMPTDDSLGQSEGPDVFESKI